MAGRKKKFSYSLSKRQIQLVIEALLIARSSGMHAKVFVENENGESHEFEGIVGDGSIDRLVDKYESEGVDYQVRIDASGEPYSISEDKLLEQTINMLNTSLGEIESAEEQEAIKKAAAETPILIEKLYEMLDEQEK